VKCRKKQKKRKSSSSSSRDYSSGSDSETTGLLMKVDRNITRGSGTRRDGNKIVMDGNVSNKNVMRNDEAIMTNRDNFVC